VNITFGYAAKSAVNSGIISSIFCVSVIFSSIAFYFLYKQKLTLYDMFGALMIITCVVLIGMGETPIETHKPEEGSLKVDHSRNLVLALIWALLTAIVLTMNSLNINYIIKTV